MATRPSVAKALGLAVILACAWTGPARADLIVNGGFESGFAGWTRADQVGSEGTFASQTGTSSPVNADPVPAPPEGSTAAMTDAQGPGSHVLYQDFVVTSPVPTAVLSFDLFIGNRAEAFVTPDTLDFATPALNQQARVDVLLASADPFSVQAADVLLNIAQTAPGDPLISGYTHHVADLTALVNGHLNTPLRLRFAEADNVFVFQLGVDNVHLETRSVPGPSSWIIISSLVLASAWARRRSCGGRR